MVKVTWTEVSVEDLHDIFDYISKNSFHYARITVDRIYKRAEQISKNPSIGRIVPEIDNDQVRGLIFRNYRLIYYIVNNERGDIMRMYHSARSLSENNVNQDQPGPTLCIPPFRSSTITDIMG
jgi:plasmid stabilization system protein ParE